MTGKRRLLLGALGLAIAALAAFAVFPTSRIDHHPLPERNPTSYVFPGTVDDVKMAIARSFSDVRHRGMFLAFTKDDNPFAKDVLSLAGNEDDAFLYTHHDPIGNSLVYSNGSAPLEYIACFHLHLSPAGTRATKVDVNTLRPEVIAGRRFAWGSCGPGMANHYVRVEPSSIEEYEFLLRIGNALGVMHMPPIKIPGSVPN